MYVPRRPSGLAAAPATATTMPVRRWHVSPWLFIGAGIIYYAGKAMMKKVRE